SASSEPLIEKNIGAINAIPINKSADVAKATNSATKSGGSDTSPEVSRYRVIARRMAINRIAVAISMNERRFPVIRINLKAKTAAAT
ncbi:MAG: hypothetical protein KAU48_11265, partial [Candidatus Thorarchaeota archaeon]|nr:hypothetical protein [Candidatus Thorarchaeota archaeon]